MNQKEIGLILGENERITGSYGDNMNALVVAPPGGGKTYSVITPNILDNSGCSMFIDDKKGSLYYKHREELENQGYEVRCFDLVTFNGDMEYNPFENIKTRDDIHKIVNFLLPEEQKGVDPFWIEAARDLAEALIDIGMHEGVKMSFEKFFDLLQSTGTKYKIHNGCEEPEEDDIDRIIQRHKIRGKSYPGMIKYKMVRENAHDTWKSIRGSCVGHMACFDSDNLFKVTGSTNVDFIDMAKKKMAIFVKSSDTSDVFYPVVNLMYREMCDRLIGYADAECSSNGFMLPIHVRFILDDFASGVMMPGFERILANCRSRNISFILSIQSLSQLESVYGKNADTIMDCVNYKVYFTSSNLGTQSYLSNVMNLPLSDIQRLRREDICIEEICKVPRMAKRYNTGDMLSRALTKGR